MNRYVYNGPIMIFDKCVSNNWHAETLAPTEKKAKSNLMSQAKTYCNLVQSAKVSLPGKLYLMKGGVD